MTPRFAGKSALITGGSRGIGAAIAQRLAAEGARVVITYAASPDAAEAVVATIKHAGGEAHAVQADAADAAAQTAAVAQAAKLLGKIDILVNNAGVADFAPIDQDQRDVYARTFAVNVGGVHACTAAAIPHMADGGRIIIIGSINAHHALVPGTGIYCATKAAVAAFARSWARDLAPRRILVNVIQPGPVDTDMNPATGAFATMLRPMVPLGRYGTVEEIASVTAFLASDEASYINGTTIDVDGGLSS